MDNFHTYILAVLQFIFEVPSTLAGIALVLVFSFLAFAWILMSYMQYQDKQNRKAYRDYCRENKPFKPPS